jgi:hypothetical protein
LLKIKKSWFYDAVERGELEVVKLGHFIRVRPSALSRYLDSLARGGHGRAPETSQAPTTTGAPLTALDDA